MHLYYEQYWCVDFENLLLFDFLVIFSLEQRLSKFNPLKKGFVICRGEGGKGNDYVKKHL